MAVEREIKSPEALPVSPSPTPPQSANSHHNRSKTLGVYFIESDDRRTAFGGGYVGGATPVNIHGKPIPVSTISKTGGWITAFFIFVFGLSVNMIVFMFYVMHRPFSSSANAVNNFLGISQVSSVLGGFLADAYLGRYWTIAIFTTIYLAFDEGSRDYQAHLDRFFNFFYLSVTLGAIIAFTAVVYIQMQHGWGSAFGSLAIAMAISNLFFFLGTPLYRHRLPGGSPLTRVA